MPPRDTSRDGTISFLWYFVLLRRIGGRELFCPRRISFAQPRRTLQNPKKVFVRVKFVFLRRFNQTVGHGAGLRATGRIGKEPVLPAHHKGLNAALGTVVAQLQTAILQIPRQVRPLLQQVVNGPAQRGFRRCFRLHLICP